MPNKNLGKIDIDGRHPTLIDAGSSKAEILAELTKIRRDPWYFITEYVYTLHPELGKTLFPNYSYLEDIVRIIMDFRFVIMLKSRQILATWLMAALAVWFTVFQYGKDVVTTSYRTKESQEFIRRVKFIHSNLPQFIKPTIGTDTKGEIEFPTRHSRIANITSSAEWGTRTYSIALAVVDEAAFIRNMEQFYIGLRPSLGDYGKVVLLSTSNGMNNFFAKLWTEENEGVDGNFIDAIVKNPILQSPIDLATDSTGNTLETEENIVAVDTIIANFRRGLSIVDPDE